MRPTGPRCPCECNQGGFCGGCGHAGCGGRQRMSRDVSMRLQVLNSLLFIQLSAVEAKESEAGWPA